MLLIDIDGFKTKEASFKVKEKRTISGQHGQVFGHACLLNAATNDIIKFTKQLIPGNERHDPSQRSSWARPTNVIIYLFIFVSFAQLLPSPSYISPFSSLYLSVSTSLSLKKKTERISLMDEKVKKEFLQGDSISYNYIYVYMCDICHVKNQGFVSSILFGHCLHLTDLVTTKLFDKQMVISIYMLMYIHRNYLCIDAYRHMYISTHFRNLRFFAKCYLRFVKMSSQLFDCTYVSGAINTCYINMRTCAHTRFLIYVYVIG